MRSDYSDIESTLVDFIESYNRLKTIGNDLSTALRGRLSTIQDDEISDIVLPVSTDAGYLKTISSAIKKHDAISALKIYKEAAVSISGVIETKRATIDKLSERILMQGDGPEVKVATSRRSALNADVTVLTKRLEYCLERFYVLRKNLVDRIIRYSNDIVRSLNNEPNEIARKHILKNKMRSELIATCDGELASSITDKECQ